jgi:hypothetical protein
MGSSGSKPDGLMEHHLYSNKDESWIMPLCGLQHVSVFDIGIKLGVTYSDILKGNFATPLNRILSHGPERVKRDDAELEHSWNQ